MTTIPNIHPTTAAEDKSRVQANIPNHIHEELFLRLFPSHGVQDRVLNIFLAWLYQQTAEVEGRTVHDRELHLKAILKPFINHTTNPINEQQQS